MFKARHKVQAVTGFLACPYHLPLTLPLVLGVLGGAGLGSFIGTGASLVYGIFTGYFVTGVGVGLFLLRWHKRSSEWAVCDLSATFGGRRAGRRRVLGAKRHASA